MIYLLGDLQGCCDAFERLLQRIDFSASRDRLYVPTDSLDQVDAWLAENADAPGALRRLVVEQRDHLARDLRVRAGVR